MKKRILSLLLTACMTLSLLPGTALAAEPLGEPTGLVWGKMLDQGKLVDMPGMVAWEKGAGQHQNEFKVILFQKTGETGKEISNQTWNTDENVTYGHASLFMLLSRDLDDGDYYFTVQAKGDGSTYTDGNVVSSSPWSYVKPAAELHTVTGLSWNWPAATWTATDGEFFSYNVQWFFSPTEDGEYRSYGQTWEIKEPQRTIPDHYILNCGEGFYKFRVRVLSRDITETRNSAWSEYSPAYHLTDLSDAVADALAGITATDPDAIRDELQLIDPVDMKSAIMADKDGTKALAQLRGLETKVGGPAGVESTVPELPVSDVSVVGASLNVLVDGVSKPTLTIGQPSVADLALPETLKDCTVSVKFSMDLAGAWTPGELQVPVRITLPVPSTINPDFLRIVHYPADGGTPEILNGVSDFTVTQAGGKNYVTFVLTHFSDFALVDAGSGEGTDPDPDQPDPPTPTAKPITKDMFKVDADEKGVVYTGSAIEPAVTGKDGEKDLTRDTDYTVDYKNNTDVGTATVIVKGKDNYSGELSYTFKITPKLIALDTATVSNKVYDGKTGATVTAVTFQEGVALTADDYAAAAVFADAKAGNGKEVTVTVTLKNGNYGWTDSSANTVKTTANITKAVWKDVPVAAVMKKAADHTDSIDLSALALPQGETFAFTVGTATNVTAALNTDGKTLELTAVEGGADTAHVTVTGESANYTVTISVGVTYTDKTPVTLSGITVAGKTYDGQSAACAGTLAAKTATGTAVALPEGSVEYEWLTAEKVTLPSAPVNAGDYILLITVDTSKKAEPPVTPSPSPDPTETPTPSPDPTETPDPAPDPTQTPGGPTTGGEEGGSSGGSSEPPAAPAAQADEPDQEQYYGMLAIPFTISKATVTVTAKNVSYKIGGTAPTYEYTVSGLASEDDWQTKPTASCPTADLDVAGKYEIAVSGGVLKGSNYNAIIYVPGTLTVRTGGSGGGWPLYSGGSSDSSSTTKPTETKPAETTVSVPTVGNGKVAIDNEKAKKGDTVTITVTPDRGYKVGKLTLTDKSGKEIPLTDKGNGKYTFTMPDSKVEVKAEFEKDAANPAQPITERFNDIKESNWYRDAVQYVYDKGMMNGVTPKNFEPALSTSRAMLVTILYRLESEPQVGPAGFADVAGDMYYASPVAWAAEKGLVTGHEDGTFRPDQELTREQLVAILYRYAKLKGYSTAKGEKNTAFTDGAVIEPYAREAVEWAASIGLVNGYQDGSFRPAGSAARAELAAILMRFCQNVAKLDG